MLLKVEQAREPEHLLKTDSDSVGLGWRNSVSFPLTLMPAALDHTGNTMDLEKCFRPHRMLRDDGNVLLPALSDVIARGHMWLLSTRKVASATEELNNSW